MEVRYAKNCSLRLKHTDTVFRLKRTGKNLLSSEYADNLVMYLGCAHKTGTLSVNDLSDTIKKITGVTQIASNDSSNSDIDDSFPAPGEHVIVFLDRRFEGCCMVPRDCRLCH